VPGPRATSPFAKYAIVAILALGAALRLWGIGGGLPLHPNLDEPHIMDRAFQMMKTGNFDPQGFYDYPTLPMYMSAAVMSVRFLDGAQHHEWRTLNDVWSGQFYLWCRAAIALLSVLTIYIVYRAGIRWGSAAAIVAALLMAVQPQLTQYAHYVLADSPMTFFVALAMLLSLCAAETGLWTWFLCAGIAAGLATATKYNGALAILMPLAALVALPSDSALRWRTAAALAVIAGAVAGFVIAAPYTVLNLPAFLNGFGDLLSKYPPPAEGKYDIYLKHIRTVFVPPSIGSDYYLSRIAATPGFLLLLAGGITIAVQMRARQTRAAAFAILLFPVAYFWFVSNQGGVSMTFDRYQQAIWPALSIWFGVGVIFVRDLVTGPRGSAARRRIVLAVLLSTLLVPAYHAYAEAQSLAEVQTAELAGQWLLDHVRKGAEPVVVESDWIHLPPVLKSGNTNSLIGAPIEAYRAQGAVYLVTCSCETEKYFDRPEQHPAEVAAYKRIYAATDVVAAFSRPGESTFTILRIR